MFQRFFFSSPEPLGKTKTDVLLRSLEYVCMPFGIAVCTEMGLPVSIRQHNTSHDFKWDFG